MNSNTHTTLTVGQFEVYFDQVLGKGATGNVYKCKKLGTDEKYAMKAIDMKNVNNEVTIYLLDCEKYAAQTIKNPYVINCEDVIQNQDFCYIAFQQCLGGTLKQYIQKKGPLSQFEALNIFRKIVQGYTSIIGNFIIHRDLKTANIMLKSNNDPVIIDFGYCEKMMANNRPLIRYNVGSPCYMSPQAYLQHRYSQKSDIWALGCILYEMLTGKTLDQGKNIKSYFEELKNMQYAPINQKFHNELIKKLLQGALCVSFNDRVTVHKLKYWMDASMGPMNIPTNQQSIMKAHNENILRLKNQKVVPVKVSNKSAQEFLLKNNIYMQRDSMPRLQNKQNKPELNNKYETAKLYKPQRPISRVSFQQNSFSRLFLQPSSTRKDKLFNQMMQKRNFTHNPPQKIVSLKHI